VSLLLAREELGKAKNMQWWKKYRDQPEILREQVDRLMAIDRKLCANSWEDQWQILQKHGHGSISGLSPAWRKRYWELGEARNGLVHSLWVDISEILNYLEGKHE